MDMVPKDIMRIIDANLNRAGEGLRVLEEFARMSLNDTSLTQRLKTVRHQVLVIESRLQEQLVEARDAGNDIGAEMKAEGQDMQPGPAAIIAANARRTEESLRVLEETAKAYQTGMDTDTYRRARFELYSVEKELLAKMLRQDRLKRLRGLYVIIDTAALKGRDYRGAAIQAINGGARTIQLRDKEHDKKELIEIALKLGGLCREKNVLFIVNDYLDVALAADADGLHVGEEDLPPATARTLLPRGKILGCSARTVEGARRAVADGADYLGVGGMFPTISKEDNEVIGTEVMRAIRKAVDVPLVAIGGINGNNAAEVMAAGADAVAVISAVLGAENIEAAARLLVKAIEGGNHG